jgi:hypothetical protein
VEVDAEEKKACEKTCGVWWMGWDIERLFVEDMRGDACDTSTPQSDERLCIVTRLPNLLTRAILLCLYYGLLSSCRAISGGMVTQTIISKLRSDFILGFPPPSIPPNTGLQEHVGL